MLRLMGAGLLLVGTTGCSLCLCRDMRSRLECLYEMKRMYELLQSQIGYCLETFPEACRAVAGNTKSPFADMLGAVYEAAGKNTGKPLPQIWEEQTDAWFPAFPLKKEDKALMRELARSLGYADRELQQRAIDNQIAELLTHIRRMEGKMAEREKIIMSFGIMGGMLLVIILL